MLLLRVECHSVLSCERLAFVTRQSRFNAVSHVVFTSFEAYTITVMKILNAAVGKRAIV